MSVKIMALVFDSSLERDKKFVALAYADHADHDGQNIYPAIATIARKTGYSERQVQRITAQLVTDGILYRTGYGPKMTYRYAINIHRLAAYEGGDILSPLDDGGDILTPGGDILSGGGDIGVTGGGDIAMSPESSFNHPIKPSIEPGDTEPMANHNHQLTRAWRGVIDIIRHDIPHQAQKQYLDKLHLSNKSDEYLFLVTAPDDNTVAWANSRLRTILRRQLSGAFDHPVDVEILLEEDC